VIEGEEVMEGEKEGSDEGGEGGSDVVERNGGRAAGRIEGGEGDSDGGGRGEGGSEQEWGRCVCRRGKKEMCVEERWTCKV
jgi:hypothetical protein